MTNNKLKELIKEEVMKILREVKQTPPGEGPHGASPAAEKKRKAARSKRTRELDKQKADRANRNTRTVAESNNDSKYPETASEYADQLNRESEGRRSGPEDFIGKLATDSEHWASQGIHTGQELAHYLAMQEYSDVYKDFYGRRPRGIDFKNMSVEKIESGIHKLNSMTKTIRGIDKDYVTHRPVRSEPTWDDEGPSTPPMDDEEAEDLHQWVSKTRDKQNRRS